MDKENGVFMSKAAEAYGRGEIVANCRIKVAGAYERLRTEYNAGANMFFYEYMKKNGFAPAYAAEGEVFEPADRELADAIAAMIFAGYIDAVAAQIGAGT